MKYILFTFLCVVSALLFTINASETSPSTEKLSEKIGSEFVHTIKSIDTINVISSDQKMNASLTRAIKSCVLNDDHFYFDKTKKCEFVPEIGFKISGKKEYIIYASYCAKQLKFIDGNHETILDCDPMGALMENTFKKAVQ